MYAIVCPFCEHKNSPDTRFCAKCGSSIHLKICSNPKCGKVNEVNANVCVACGEPFLKSSIVEVEPAPGNDVAAAAVEDIAQVPPAPKSRVGVWPLLMVAIVAGGLPLIWANRSLLPTPKTWQGSPATETKDQAAPVKLAPKIELPKPEPAPPKPATPDQGTSSPSPAAPAATEPGDKPAAPSKPKKPVKTPAPKPAAPERACTDATIALGLCEPKKAAR